MLTLHTPRLEGCKKFLSYMPLSIGGLLLVFSLAVRAQAADESFSEFLIDVPSNSSEDSSHSPETATPESVPTDPSSLPDRALSQSKQPFFYAKPGPWGRLRCFYIFLEPPLEMVEQMSLPHSKTQWTFKLSDLPGLPGLFQNAGLPETMIARLLEPANRRIDNEMCILYPTLADIESMTPSMREVIYPVLALTDSNEFLRSPIIMTTDSVDEWYRTSRLRPETIDKIRQMSYRKNGAFAFSDLSALLNYAQSEQDVRLMIKSLLRTRSIMIHMELTSEQDLESIVEYWAPSRYRRRKDILPIMQSIVDTQGIDTLGFTHILPALPRKLLYTYPGPNYSLHGTLPDCHWTTFNFFNYEPHEYLLDKRLAANFVKEKCVPASQPHQFGDLVFFVDPRNQEILHSCVYLADDMVFTKNGMHWISPWVIMSLGDVEKIYSRDGNLLLVYYRLKEPS